MSRRLAALAGAAAPGLALLLPRAAAACAVCTSGREDETQLAFLLTTIFMSILPLAIVGGGVWWLVRRSRQLNAEAERPERGFPARAAVSRTSSLP